MLNADLADITIRSRTAGFIGVLTAALG